MTIRTDSGTLKCFFNTCWLLLLLTLKIALRDKLLVNEKDSECHKAVSDSEVHKADQVSEVRLVGEIDDELDAVSEVDYDEVCEVGEADK